MITITDWAHNEHTGPTIRDTVEDVWGAGARLSNQNEFGHWLVTRLATDHESAVHVIDRVRRIDGVEEDVDDTLLDSLRDSADRTGEAEAEYRHWRGERDALIVRAAALGVPKISIASSAGITRVMVDRIIKRDTAE